MNPSEKTEFIPCKSGSGFEQPTKMLRFVIRGDNQVLQQLWQDPNEFLGTWRDVPIVDEAQDANTSRQD